MAQLVDDQLFGKKPDGRIVDPDLLEGGLRSKQFATVVDLLGYGEIDSIFDEGGEGTDTFRKNVFLDNTPLQNSQGQENFQDVEVFVKNGTDTQTSVFADADQNRVENTTSVGAALTNAPFATTKTGSYVLAGAGGQTVSGVTLAANQMLVTIDSAHGYAVGDVIQWENTDASATEQNVEQSQQILSIPTSTTFVIDTTFEDKSFTGASCNVKTSVGLSRTINGVTDSSGTQLVNKLRVTLQFPALQQFLDDGDIIGAEVKISIRITENDGTVHNPVVLDIINGRASSPYLKDYEILLEKNMSFPLTLSVFRNVNDSTDPRTQNASNWLSFTEIQLNASAYQGFAYVVLRFNAQEFQGYPRRMYRIKGTKIKVPHDTTVDSTNGRVIYPDNYTFNGTFKTDKEWCADPAWVLYDLLTTDKGFGGTNGVIEEDSLDVFSFYSASAYASELITDPLTNTTEPRFSTNVILNQKKEAYTLINDLCSVMRAMPFYSAGSLTISQDRPTNTDTNTSDAQYVFTNANVTEEGFSYSGAGTRTKFTEVEVAYFDNDTKQVDFEYVEVDDITSLAGYKTRYGATRKTIKSFACTSRGQANRLGRWFLYSNLKESEICTFKTTLEAGVVVRPQMIIAIADSFKAGVRRGGRIKSVSSSTVFRVDDKDNTDLTDGTMSQISVVMPDGSVSTKGISSVVGNQITLSSALSATPQVNAIYAITNTDVKFQIFRVISVEEENHCEYKITAIIHDTDKYEQIEDTNIPSKFRPITTLFDAKPAPSNLTATEQIVVLNNRAVSKIFIAWEPVQGVKEYLIQFRFGNDNPELRRVNRPSFELFETKAGTYDFAVKSYNSLGKLSRDTSFLLDFESQGKTALPADVQNLSVETVSDSVLRLRFDQSTDIDVTHGGTLHIRSTNLSDGTGTFTKSTDLIPALSGNVTEAIVPNIRNGEIILKFKDDGGRFSAGETSVIINSPRQFSALTVLSEREDTDSPPFAGTKTNCFFSDSVNGLVLDSTTLFDSVLDVDQIPDFDFSGDIASSGTYEFANKFDLGSKFNLNLLSHSVTQGFLPNNLIDSRTANINTWTDFDGASAIDTNVKLFVAHTDSDPSLSNSATYGQSGTTITVTKSSHGLTQGSFVVIDFTAGSATDGNYEIISVPNANTFTVTSSTEATISSGTSCTYGAEFTKFTPFINGRFTARGFKFKAELTSSDPAQSVEIDQLGFIAELESRTETSLTNASATNGLIASGTSAKTVTFTDPFFTGQSGTSVAANSVKPSIAITIENAQSGDFFAITSISSTAFVIEIKNGSSFVDRNFKYSATGFGRGS